MDRWQHARGPTFAVRKKSYCESWLFLKTCTEIPRKHFTWGHSSSNCDRDCVVVFCFSFCIRISAGKSFIIYHFVCIVRLLLALAGMAVKGRVILVTYLQERDPQRLTRFCSEYVEFHSLFIYVWKVCVSLARNVDIHPSPSVMLCLVSYQSFWIFREN